MMQSVNYHRRPLWLLLLVCCCAFVWAGCSERRSEQHRLEGDAYLKLHKLNEASAAYQKSDIANPKNALAKLGLGRCLLLEQKNEEALAQFTKAYELKPDLEAAYVDAANVLLRTNRPEDALKVAQQCAAASPEHGGVLQGALLIRLGRLEEAVKLLTGLRDQFPKSADIRVNLATTLVALKKPADAEQELKTVLGTIDANSIAARMVLADVYKAEGKTDASLEELRKLQKDNPGDSGIKLALARGLANSGKTDEAQTLAHEVLQKDPGSGWANYVIGCCLLDQKKNAEALQYLQAAEQALPGQPELAQRIAAAKSGGEGVVARPAAQVEAPAPSDWTSLWKQASLATLLRQKDTFLEKADANVKDTLVVAALVTRAFGLADAMAKNLPEASPLRGVIEALKARKPEDLMKTLDAWKEQDPERQILHENTLGVALASIGARTRAFQVLAKCYQSWPDNAVSLYNIAQMFQEADMSESAAKTLQRLIAQYPGNADAYVLLNAILRDGGMLKEARNSAEAAYSLFPNSRDLVLTLCQAYMDTKDPEAARRVLDRAIQARPDDVALKLELAVMQMQSGAPDDALKTLEGLSLPGPLESRGLMVKGFASAIRGEWEKVPGVFGAMKDGDVDPAKLNPAVRMLLASAYVREKKNADALKVLSAPDASRLGAASRFREVASKALGGAPANLNEAEKGLADALEKDSAALGEYLYGAACLSVQLNGPAVAILKKLDADMGFQPQLVQSAFSALTHVQPGEHPKEQAEELVKRHAKNPMAWAGLAMVLRSLDDVEGERQALAKGIELGPNEPEIWFQQGQFCERQKDVPGAAEAYRHLADLRPDDAAANNNVAYCLLVTGGDVKEALERATKAKEKLPTNPAVLHTLGVALLRSGNLEESRKNLSVALEMKPGDPTILLDYGLLLNAEKKPDEGKRHIELALKYANQLGLDFPRKAEAEQLLAGK